MGGIYVSAYQRISVSAFRDFYSSRRFASWLAGPPKASSSGPGRGAYYTSRYSLIVSALERLKVNSICLDEVMCFTEVQRDFDKLWSRTHDHEARLCAFDLLEVNGEDLRDRPLAERKKRLLKLIRRRPNHLRTRL